MKIAFGILLFFCTDISNAQVVQQNNIGGIAIRGGFGNEISIADVNGRPFERKYKDIEGSPFLFQDYRLAIIELFNGKKYDSTRLKVDLFLNQTNVITIDKREFYLPSSTVTSLFFIDSNQNDSTPYFFKCGFPPIGELTNSQLYQVLVEGKCTLLKSICKRLNVRKNDLSGEETKEFETYEIFIFF